MNGKGIERIHFDEIGSTNDYAKSLRAQGADVVVTADRQMGGRGTKGRAFSSETGGVYVTKLTFYDGLLAKNAFQIMASAAVAVCETLEFYGLRPVIKWVNDIYVEDKKICGILIENVFSGDKVSSSIVGIGLNVCNELPTEIESIATTMARILPSLPTVQDVRERLIANLSASKGVEDYLQRIGYMGRRATAIVGEEHIPVTLLSVDETGGLWVEMDGEKRRFAAAEISLQV